MTEQRKMTIEEVGHKGGEARAHKYSKEELSEQAKKAAKTVEEKYPGFHSEIGAKGGEARAEKNTKEELSEQAKKAAKTVEEKYPGFHSEIGSKSGRTRGTQRKAEAVGVTDEPEEEEEE